MMKKPLHSLNDLLFYFGLKYDFLKLIHLIMVHVVKHITSNCLRCISTALLLHRKGISFTIASKDYTFF